MDGDAAEVLAASIHLDLMSLAQDRAARRLNELPVLHVASQSLLEQLVLRIRLT